MKTAITVLIALVLVLLTVIGIYTVTDSIVSSGSSEVAGSSGSFSSQFRCATLGGDSSECGDIFDEGDD